MPNTQPATRPTRMMIRGYDPGRGNYVEERRELFRDLTLEEAIARARSKSAGGDA